MRALGLAILACVGLPAAAAAQVPSVTSGVTLPIAYFSPQRAFFSSADGKVAHAKLTSLQAERSKEIDARNAVITEMQAALQRTTTGLDAATLRLREQEIERFSLDLQRYIQDAQAEFLGVQKELESAFLAKLTPALSLVVKDRGLMLVLNEDAGVIAWADPSLDITSDVVRRIQP